MLAGQLATFAPAHFVLGGLEWTSIHILFFLSALGRLASAGLAVRLQDPGARGGVPELMRSLSAPIRAKLERLMPQVVAVVAAEGGREVTAQRVLALLESISRKSFFSTRRESSAIWLRFPRACRAASASVPAPGRRT